MVAVRYGTVPVRNGTERYDTATVQLQYGKVRNGYGTIQLGYDTTMGRHGMATVWHGTVSARVQLRHRKRLKLGVGSNKTSQIKTEGLLSLKTFCHVPNVGHRCEVGHGNSYVHTLSTAAFVRAHGEP